MELGSGVGVREGEGAARGLGAMGTSYSGPATMPPWVGVERPSWGGWGERPEGYASIDPLGALVTACWASGTSCRATVGFGS